jgi:hypothetical protein
MNGYTSLIVDPPEDSASSDRAQKVTIAVPFDMLFPADGWGTALTGRFQRLKGQLAGNGHSCAKQYSPNPKISLSRPLLDWLPSQYPMNGCNRSTSGRYRTSNGFHVSEIRRRPPTRIETGRLKSLLPEAATAEESLGVPG